MDAAISAVTCELISRLFSFLIKKYTSHVCLEEKQERLQQLLLRVQTVVEEAEGRYITNSAMLAQLKILVECMYRGYYVLNTFKHRAAGHEESKEEVSCSYSLSSTTTPVKRFRTTERIVGAHHELQSALGNLETVVANMTEFVMLLGSCERMSRSPYDMYLYIDNFMFGRQVEKQQIVNILLQNNNALAGPAVLPIIGGCRVGKKTLVGHVCNENKVRSCFSSILHLKEDNILQIDCHNFMHKKTLVVIEFMSDVTDEDWVKFYSSLRCIGEGSKVIVISRIEELARFGTVSPIRVQALSYEEYSYLFKVLAFGSSNPNDNPSLASMAGEFATVLSGSFVTANVIANALRSNLVAGFWQRLLTKFSRFVDHNLSVYGEHPKHILEKDRMVNMSKFNPSSSFMLRLMPPCVEVDDSSKKDMPKVMFIDLMIGPSVVLPKGEFEVVVWESRIPPYTKYFACCYNEKPQHAASPRGKRRAMDVY